MIVVDTNVVSYFVIEGEHTKRAEAVRRRDHDWRVPELFVHEWLNVVTFYVHKKIFSRDQAVRAYQHGLSLINIEPLVIEPVRMINLHLRTGCASYDCQFAALAEDLNVQLITADKELADAFPELAENLKLI